VLQLRPLAEFCTILTFGSSVIHRCSLVDISPFYLLATGFLRADPYFRKCAYTVLYFVSG